MGRCSTPWKAMWKAVQRIPRGREKNDPFLTSSGFNQYIFNATKFCQKIEQVRDPCGEDPAHGTDESPDNSTMNSTMYNVTKAREVILRLLGCHGYMVFWQGCIHRFSRSNVLHKLRDRRGSRMLDFVFARTRGLIL